MQTIFPVLTSGKLVLRQFAEADLERVFAGLSHPDVVKYYGISYKTLEETRQQLTFFNELEKKEKGIWWAICSSRTHEFFGAGGLNNWNKEHQKAEIGFWLLPRYWRQGIMTEAMPLICNYGFEQLTLHRIEGFVESENMNCKKALAKLNFIYEGTMKDCEIKNGKFISLDIYAKWNNTK